MKLKGYYSTGEFISKAHVTKKTIRYYDEHNILKPSYVNENGARFYTDKDFAKLQQILFLKYLGFSLDDIKQMTLNDDDMLKSLNMQTSLVNEKIEQLKLVKDILNNASLTLNSGKEIDWSNLINEANLKEMENALKNQYLNSSNIEARILLHSKYGHNKLTWFKWLYKQLHLKDNEKILELGCGDGSLWTNNLKNIPSKSTILLTDISEGMIRDVKRRISDKRFKYEVMDACHINAKDNSFDVVIANHLLFYVDDIKKCLKEVKRVLKPNGMFICTAYSNKHMKEIDELCKEFDKHIELSKDKLYERFGKDNGQQILSKVFDEVKWNQYEDYLLVTNSDDLIEYIISCHGNQNRYIVDKFKEFKSFVSRKCSNGFYITKDAGAFIAIKK